MWWPSYAQEWTQQAPQHRASAWTREWTRPQPWAQWEPNRPRHTERGRRSRTRGRSDGRRHGRWNGRSLGRSQGRSRSRGRSSGRRSSSSSSAATDVNDEGADDAAGFEQTTSGRRRRTDETTTLEMFECSPTFSNADDENNQPKQKKPRVATSKISDSQSRAQTPQQQPQSQPRPHPRMRRQQQKQFKAFDSKCVIKGKPSAQKAHDEAKARFADLGALSERFPSSLAAGIMKRDQEASAAYDSLSRRARIGERCHEMANARNQSVMDSESESYQEIDKAKKPPEPRFRTGQSIFQYWASWMALADDLPANIKKKGRPGWYSGEIIAYLQWETVKYAGMEITGHTYRAH